MRKAFTLIELLVTIAIIAILAMLVTVSFTSVRKQARDARRQTDVKTYATALEKYHITNGSYFVALNQADPGLSKCLNENINVDNPNCTGAEGASYGRINFSGLEEARKNYSQTSIASALLKLGLIDKIARDPLNNKEDTVPGQPDYVLMRCKQGGAQTIGRDDTAFSIWVHLEKTPNIVSVENSGSSCGGNSEFTGDFASNQVTEVTSTDSSTRIGSASSGYVSASGGLVHSIVGQDSEDINTHIDTHTDIDREITEYATLSIVGPEPKNEGNSGTNTQVRVKLTLSEPLTKPATVSWTTIDGTDRGDNHAATLADNDYEPGSGTIVFAPQITSMEIPITIIGDNTVEPVEIFGVKINAASSNLIIGNTPGVIKILNDDADGYNGNGDDTGQVCSLGSQIVKTLEVPNHASSNEGGYDMGETAVGSFYTNQIKGATLKITSFSLDDVAIIVKDSVKISDVLTVHEGWKYNGIFYNRNNSRFVSLPQGSFLVYNSDLNNFSSGYVDDWGDTTYSYGNKSYFIPGGHRRLILKDLNTQLNMPMMPYNQINLITLADNGYWDKDTGRLSFKMLHVAHGVGNLSLTYQVNPCR